MVTSPMQYAGPNREMQEEVVAGGMGGATDPPVFASDVDSGAGDHHHTIGDTGKPETDKHACHWDSPEATARTPRPGFTAGNYASHAKGEM